MGLNIYGLMENASYIDPDRVPLEYMDPCYWFSVVFLHENTEKGHELVTFLYNQRHQTLA